MVFRKVYGEEIEQIDPKEITEDIERKMTLIRRQTAWYKSLGG